MANLQILPPRVPFMDPRNGLISREWYRFLRDLFDRVGGQSDFSLDELQYSPPQQDLESRLQSMEASLAQMREESELMQFDPVSFGAPRYEPE